MSRFSCYFVGRKLGAVGIFCDTNVTVEAKDEKEARDRIYEKYDLLYGVINFKKLEDEGKES